MPLAHFPTIFLLFYFSLFHCVRFSIIFFETISTSLVWFWFPSFSSFTRPLLPNILFVLGIFIKISVLLGFIYFETQKSKYFFNLTWKHSKFFSNPKWQERVEEEKGTEMKLKKGQNLCSKTKTFRRKKCKWRRWRFLFLLLILGSNNAVFFLL